MRVKTYQAPNIGAAMAMVREELGPDALILSSRSLDDGIEVTAAHEAGAPAPHAGDDVDWGAHGLPPDLAARLIGGDLARTLRETFTFAPLPSGEDARPVMLVGPPGAGKTMTTARLATRLHLGARTPHVITSDGRRAGAAEQLAAFTRLLGLNLIVADTPTQLARAVERCPERAPALIDSPGLDPSDPADRDYLHQCRTATNARVALVLPAGLDPAEAEELALGFKQLGATHLVATRLDQSRRLGGILAAAATGLALADAGVTTGVVDGLQRITPTFLAARLASRRTPSIPAEAPPSAPASPLALLIRSRSQPPRAST